MKKSLLVLFLLVFIVFSCSQKEETKETKFKIGVSQIVSHPALDAAREGFKEAFKEKGIEVEYIDTNANGDLATLELNTKKLVNQNVDLIYAIATPSAQVAQNATTEIPIVFSAVTDAKSAKLENDNVTGILDAVDITKQLELLLKVSPEVKTIGFIYNAGEQNSVFQLEQLKLASSKLNLNVVEKSASQINEIPQVLQSLIQSSDAIYTPTDNLVASSINLIAEKILEAKKVSLGAEKAHVEGGILMTIGIDYFNLGKEAGKRAIEILVDGKKANEIEITGMSEYEEYVNENTKKSLGLEF